MTGNLEKPVVSLCRTAATKVTSGLEYMLVDSHQTETNIMIDISPKYYMLVGL